MQFTTPIAVFIAFAGCTSRDSHDAFDAPDNAAIDGASDLSEYSLGDTANDIIPADIIEVADAVAEAGVPHLALRLDRESGATSTRIDVTVTVIDAEGRAVPGLAVNIQAPAADIGAQREDGSGDYFATLTPHAPSGEVAITASTALAGAELSASSTALVLPFVDDGWNQAEVLGAPVNTPGFEGDANVSLDGHWLLVSGYSPVDVPCCTRGCRTPAMDTTYCQRSQGPYAGPSRPGFFGSWRIVDTTHIRNQCPSLCEVAIGGTDVSGFLSPPSAGYVFHRMDDGSFAEPHVFGFDADGCAPVTSAMPTDLTSTSPLALFAHSLDNAPRALFAGPLVLGADNIWGRYTCDTGVPVLHEASATPLSLAASDVSDPFFDGSRLWFTTTERSAPRISFAMASGALPGATFGSPTNAPIASSSENIRHPFLDVFNLFFERNGAIALSTVSGDPSLATSWSTPSSVLSAEVGDFVSGRVGAVVTLASPSLADAPDGGPDELYFVYGRVTATGSDFNVARIAHR